MATLFNTNKTINQMQGGVAVDQVLNADTSLRVTGYGGQRQVRQYLALSGVGATSSGGVVDLDRNFEGVGVRLIHRNSLMDRPLTLNVGADADRLHELRQGFVNNNGAIGALRRNEDDTVTSGDVYAEARWDLADRILADAGRALEPGPLRIGRSLHRRAQSGRQRIAHLLQHQPHRRPGLARHRKPERLRELRPGIRDADIRGNGLPARRARASTWRSIPRPPPPVKSG